MNDLLPIANIFSLGVTIAIADKVLIQADRRDIAFLVTFIGFLLGVGMTFPAINKIFVQAFRMLNY